MQELERELEQMQQRLQRDESIMSDQERQRAGREFQQKMAEAQQRGERLNQQMQRRHNEERDRLLQQMQGIIADIAEAEGLDVVLEASGIAYARDKLDISRKVLERMTQD
jgi:outer membrane protein